MSTENEEEKVLSTGTDEPKGKVKRFCVEYIKDYKVKDAAIRAGYSEKSAGAQGSRMLKNANVAAYVHELEEQFLEESGFLSKERVVREIWDTYRKASNAVPVMVWDYKEHEMVEAEGEYQFDGRTATKCLELLTKHLGVPDKIALENAKGENGEKEGFKVIVEVTEDED